MVIRRKILVALACPRTLVAVVVCAVLLGGGLVGASSARASVADVTYDDPFAYCAAVGTINSPDARYTGPGTPDVVTEPFGWETGYRWRCINGSVWSCSWGANLPCGKAITRTTPAPRVKRFCRNNPNSFVPAAVTWHAAIYAWDCKNGRAKRGRQVWHVDGQGFVKEVWRRVSPPTTTPPTTSPFVACSDGLDNDSDGKTDYPADPGCSGTTDTSEVDAPSGPMFRWSG